MDGLAPRHAVLRERTIQEVNEHRQAALQRFLEFFCHLPSFIARTAHLEGFSLEHLIIVSTGHRNVVFFDPPLESWADAETRVIEMDQQALAGLGRGAIVVTEYVPPTGWTLVVFVCALFGVPLLCKQSNFLPGSWLYENIFGILPDFAHFISVLQPYVFPFVVALHACETAWMDYARLQKHGVARFTLLWWKWLLSCAVEGYGSTYRFDALVQEKTRAEAGGKS